jgi:hypothetical protein
MLRIKFLRFLTPVLAAALTGCAHHQAVVKASEPPPVAPARENDASATAIDRAVKSEQVRMDCIAGRRLICGRIVKVLRDGLVVESGYTDLLRPPLTASWLIPATVPAKRDSGTIELRQPGTPCIGLVLLTDTPKRPKPKVLDYVVIIGYPAGSYRYQAAPGIRKPIRKFAAGLDTAVRLTLQAQENHTAGALPMNP